MRRLDHPYLLLSACSLFWAGNTIVGRAAVDLVPPGAMTFVRWAIAFVVLLPFAWTHVARDWPAIRRHLVAITAFALIGSAGYNVVAYLALHYTQAINSLLLQSVAPVETREKTRSPSTCVQRSWRSRRGVGRLSSGDDVRSARGSTPGSRRGAVGGAGR